MTGRQTLNRMAHLFRVLSKPFRVAAVRNQKCSEFEDVFDLAGRFSVQSCGMFGSENAKRKMLLALPILQDRAADGGTGNNRNK